MPTKPPKLPDKLSDLLDLAVKDALRLSRGPRPITLNMCEWVRASNPRTKSRCQACLAGSVMLARLGARRDQSASSEDYPAEIGNKLDAINCLRGGFVTTAWYWLENTGIDCARDANAEHGMKAAALAIMADYSADRDGGRAKWSTYRKAARMLRAVGL